MEAAPFDPLLAPFLEASREPEAQRHLEQLFTQHIQPKVQMVLKSKLGGAASYAAADYETRNQADRDDLSGEINALLLRRLYEARERTDTAPIQNILDFVTVAAYNAVNMYLRKRYPRRHSLVNKMRYLLEHRSGVAVWKSENGDDLCGFVVWKEQNRKAESSDRLRVLLDDPPRWARNALGRETAQSIDPARLVQACFQAVGHPIRLDDLVRVVAELWEVKDQPSEPPPEDDHLSEATTAYVAPGPEEAVVGELDMRRYWEMVRRLSPYQCAALLLQARDPAGNSLIELLELEGIASLREIATVINLPPEELAALTNDLPLNDAEIARRLQVTAQHVARLRMLARRRLSEQLGVHP